MNKRRVVFLAVLLTTAVVVTTLYNRGLLWKRNLYITTPQRICPAHKTPMKREMVRARTGRAIADPGPIQIEMERLFPCKNDVYLGGHPPNVGMFEREYCGECREGAEKWYAQKIVAEQDAAGDGDKP
jgi:hypothetical protein